MRRLILYVHYLLQTVIYYRRKFTTDGKLPVAHIYLHWGYTYIIYVKYVCTYIYLTHICQIYRHIYVKYVCTYIFDIYMQIHIYLIYIFKYICTYIFDIHIQIHIYLHVYVYQYLNISLCLLQTIYMSIYMHINIQMHIYLIFKYIYIWYSNTCILEYISLFTTDNIYVKYICT